MTKPFQIFSELKFIYIYIFRSFFKIVNAKLVLLGWMDGKQIFFSLFKLNTKKVLFYNNNNIFYLQSLYILRYQKATNKTGGEKRSYLYQL